MVHLHVHNGTLYTVTKNAYKEHAFIELTRIVFLILPRVFKHIAILTDKLNEVFNELKLPVPSLYACFTI